MALPRLRTLAEIEAAVWQELTRAPRDKHHEWRTPVLATVDESGADARSVVLREVDVRQRLLVVYTDSRAAKVTQLRAQPAATLLLWSRRLGWQLRCRVHGEVFDEGLAVSSRWSRVKLLPAAQDYLSPAAPGSDVGAVPTHPAALAHRECFAVIEAKVVSIDWLDLHAEGHRRARFDEGAVARWLVP